MTQANREACIKATLKWEGGYTNDPRDPGGATNWGITINDAKTYWKKNATPEDVRKMPLDIAIDIYRSKYWKTKYYDCDKLNPGVDLAVFDAGVNSGPAQAKKWLDRSIGGTDEETINKYFDARLAMLQKLKTWPTFGQGWTNRCRDLRKLALSMTKQTGTSAPITKAAGAGTGAAAVAYGAWYMYGLYGLAIAAVVGVVIAIAVAVHNKAKANAQKDVNSV